MRKYIVFVLFLIGIAGTVITCKDSKEIQQVEVSGRKIMVDQVPYTIKGICYHPVPKGSDERDFENLNQDLELMKEAGINTIRGLRSDR